MRRLVVSCAAVASLVAIGGCVSPRWVEAQVQAEVERAFTAMRLAGATATHGTVRFDAWSRTLRIDRIAIEGDAGAAVRLTIGSVKAEAMATRGTSVSASAVELADVEVQRSPTSAADWTLAARIPSIRLTDVVLPQKPPAGTDASDAALVAGLLQATRIGAIAAATIDALVKMPAQSGGFLGARKLEPREASYSYSSVRIERIADGRMAALGAEKIAVGGTAGKGSIDGFSMTDIDILPFLAIAPASRRAVNGYHRVVGRHTVGAMALETPDGAMQIGSMSGEGFGIDREKLAHWRMMSLATGVIGGSQPPSPAEISALSGRIADLYEAIEVGRFELRDMRFSRLQAPPLASVSIGALIFEGLERGRLRQLRLEGITAPPPGGRISAPSMRIGAFAVEGLQVSRLMRLLPAIDPAARQPPPDPAVLLSLAEGLEVRDTSVPDPVSGHPLRIERAAATWGRPVGGVPADIRLAIKGDWPISPRDVGLAPLRQWGLQALSVDAEVAWRYDEHAEKLALAPYRIAIARLGVLDTRLTLADLPRSAYGLQPSQVAAAMSDTSLEALELRLTDGGLVELLDKLPPSAGAPGAKAAFLDAARGALDPARDSGGVRAVIDGLDRMLAAPGRTMAVKLTPRSRVSLAELTQVNPLAGLRFLQDALERLDVTVAVAP